MLTPTMKFRGAVTAGALALSVIGLGAGSAQAAADWPPLQEGAYLYSGNDGSGTVTAVDLGDVGTCHTLAAPVRSVQIVSGSASVTLYPAGGCAGDHAWASGSLTQSNLPLAALSYRVLPA
ncbi:MULTISPECIES: hypothetical protein [unclassified Streptomyces]|uniref:hypothetical protein n=1 Tax=unclassified Streptomyces TaxID=2593676 RepID=UPI000DBA96D3|nr:MULTISPECIES: hypothetical protein [unclassified Streptomyces]MYT69059.1 hypothetical protein [Streptomyces sp. SID8367]RAJ82567.1 hypothetical protein K377_04287 [Streptomyces sp. PsTaAH-137]